MHQIFLWLHTGTYRKPRKARTLIMVVIRHFSRLRLMESLIKWWELSTKMAITTPSTEPKSQQGHCGKFGSHQEGQRHSKTRLLLVLPTMELVCMLEEAQRQ